MSTDISTEMVKALRRDTGAGILDCKKALSEAEGDIEKARELLRKKGMASAAKKADRTAVEGLVSFAIDKKIGVMIELNSETDFVAMNQMFKQMVAGVTAAALRLARRDGGVDLAALLAAPLEEGGAPIEAKVLELSGTIGEKIALRRAAALVVPEGTIHGYAHLATGSTAGKQCVLASLRTAGQSPEVARFGDALAIHICGYSPQPRWHVRAAVPADALERETAYIASKVAEMGKPPKVAAQMQKGMLETFYKENVLGEQPFLVEGFAKPGATVAAALQEVAARAGAPAEVGQFVRMKCGEVPS